MTDSDIAYLTAAELLDTFKRRDLSPVEVTEAALAQIERHDREVNAFCLVDAERALEAARASEQRWHKGEPKGMLDGITVAVKDIFLTKGWPTLRGSRLIDPDQPWEVDAPVVASLRRTGAVLIGKTTTPELGWKGVTDSPLYGVTRNPWDNSRTAGGSSGGSSVALVHGMAALALGTDGGGSIRIPAGFCGHPGLKPTYGRVPLWPVSPYGTLAHAGPMARTVEDLALLLDIMAEPDRRDWTALPPNDVAYREQLGGEVSGLRIAYSPDLGFVQVDPEVAVAVEEAVRWFEEEGAHVEQADPGFEDPIHVYKTLWDSGAAQATRHYSEDQLQLMDPGLQRITAEGVRYTVIEYLDAAAQRGELGVRMSLFHEKYDLLLMPTLPILAFEAGRDVPEDWPDVDWPSWTPFSYPFNLTQQPAASVPCGFTRSGLPIGLQIVGAKYADDLVLRAAHAYESAHSFSRQRPG